MTPPPAHGWTSIHSEKVNIGIIPLKQRMIIFEKTLDFPIVKTTISLCLLVNLWSGAAVMTCDCLFMLYNKLGEKKLPNP